MNPSSSSAAEQLCRRFKLDEIRLATGDFSDEHIIGKGGFGKVYKGVIDEGSTAVAIKRLAPNSNQGEREFVTEIETLSKLRHHNLVSLIGYCDDKEQGEMILVYEYMPNGTLADRLHKHVQPPLTWNQRLKICVGAARALHYLHTGTSIIHRDVKPSNILLDENFESKVSDFGLAKYLSAHNLQTHVTTNVKGSFGYFDPIYFVSRILTRESDTYAFGVVLLEVLCGKPAVDPGLPDGEPHMTMWALEKIQNGKANQIVAADLREEISEDCLKTFVRIPEKCLDLDPKKRMTMTQVVAQLEHALLKQEMKGTPHKLQIRPFINIFCNRFIPSGTTQEDANQKEEQHNVQTNICQAIPFDELKYITNDFSLNRMFDGEHMCGVLRSGQKVAIKKLEKQLPEHEFLAQVSKMSNLKHENVVTLHGYCSCTESGVQALAYEFAPRGSLQEFLNGKRMLSWARTIKIAVGAARGLHYIHEKGLIHHNINSSNVLLFDDETAKITNIIHPSTDEPALISDVNHSPDRLGFQTPESDDVYCFGLVLLELLIGDKFYDRGRQADAVNFLSRINKGKLARIKDSRLRRRFYGAMERAGLSEKDHKAVYHVDARFMGDYPPKAVATMAKVVASCLQIEPNFRPNMSGVLESLNDVLRETHFSYDYLSFLGVIHFPLRRMITATGYFR